MSDIPEGCTPADAQMLREENHRLAQESHNRAMLLIEWLNTSLDAQDEEFEPWIESFTARAKEAVSAYLDSLADQDKQMAAGFGAALAMTEEAVSETLEQREERLTQEQRERVKAIWRNLRAEAIRSPEDEAMEFARRLRAEQGKQEPVASMLYLGGTYETQGGELVKMVGIENIGTPYETLVDEAGVNRYSRRVSDAGRCTGSAHDYSDPKNIKRPFAAKALNQINLYASPTPDALLAAELRGMEKAAMLFEDMQSSLQWDYLKPIEGATIIRAEADRLSGIPESKRGG